MLCNTGCNIDLISLDTAKKLRLKISKEKIYKIKDAQDNFLKAVGETTVFVAREGTNRNRLNLLHLSYSTYIKIIFPNCISCLCESKKLQNSYVFKISIFKGSSLQKLTFIKLQKIRKKYSV